MAGLRGVNFSGDAVSLNRCKTFGQEKRQTQKKTEASWVQPRRTANEAPSRPVLFGVTSSGIDISAFRSMNVLFILSSISLRDNQLDPGQTHTRSNRTPVTSLTLVWGVSSGSRLQWNWAPDGSCCLPLGSHGHRHITVLNRQWCESAVQPFSQQVCYLNHLAFFCSADPHELQLLSEKAHPYSPRVRWLTQDSIKRVQKQPKVAGVPASEEMRDWCWKVDCLLLCFTDIRERKQHFLGSVLLEKKYILEKRILM